jgi:hypothetical protein
MSITATTGSTDPYGPLAWATSLAVVALEKLRVVASPGDPGGSASNIELEIDEDEREALGTVGSELLLLSQASLIPVNDLFVGKNGPLTSALRDGFSTLVAIEKEMSPRMGRVDFKETGTELLEIRKGVEAKRIDLIHVDRIEKAQQVCLDLLEHIDRQRPPISLH